MVVYHGTPNGTFSIFDKETIGSTWNADEIGFFFTDRKQLAEEYTKPFFKENTAKPNLFKVYLSIQNPLVIDAKWWKEHFGRSDIYKHDAIEIWDNEQRVIIEALKKCRYDGIIIDPNPWGGAPKMFVALEPTQIKSTTDNIGTFDPTNPDIRFGRRVGVGEESETAYKPIDRTSEELAKKAGRGDKKALGELYARHPMEKAIKAYIGKKWGLGGSDFFNQ